eukprot:6338616-Pyramimonas_sp.AAC.1
MNSEVRSCIFTPRIRKAPAACSKQRRARKELYEARGGNLVDGLPPAASFVLEIQQFVRAL